MARRRSTAAGVPMARREALWIWTEISGESLSDTVAGDALDAPGEPATTAYAAAIRRRAAGEPLAYVTGRTGFRHLTLRTDRRALIPRPETEGLVDLVLARVRRGRVADVGTGTGCIALSLATEGAFDQVVAIDRSAEALALAGENRRLHGVPDRARAGRSLRADRGRQPRRAGVKSPLSYGWRVRRARRCGAGLGAAGRTGEWGRRPRGHWRGCSMTAEPWFGPVDGWPWKSIALGRRCAPGGRASRAGPTSPFMQTFSAASATCSRAGAMPRDLG